MYFQICSNSAYPQHSGERYRTSGPLGFKVVLDSFVFVLRKIEKGFITDTCIHCDI